ncbi:MAG TPA: BlaI/MecI/CopY family transcriptional regulator [Bryobacteraceae bacterium]|nr:BlaI/MecI/CopY family transcriptional regulator [Bryobacteraceae bacterium]
MPRSGAPREIPPPLELECLQALWKLREANVRDVRESLAGRRPLAYTTVMTLLERLVRKGAATRRKAGRSFLYAAVLEREALRRVAVRQLVESFFDGSPADLAAYLRTPRPEPAPEPDPAPEHTLDPALL